MRIGSFIKQSFIDWSGLCTAVIFTRACNFRCAYCHNPDLVIPELFHRTPDVSIVNVFEYLNSRKGWIDGVVITGGEPTCHNDLITFIQRIKSLGYKIKLDTNGTDSETLQSLINDKLVDYVAMDIKNILNYEEYKKVCVVLSPKMFENILSSISILRSSDITCEFRTTLLKSYHSEEIVKELKHEFKNDTYTLQNYREGDVVGYYL